MHILKTHYKTIGAVVLLAYLCFLQYEIYLINNIFDNINRNFPQAVLNVVNEAIKQQQSLQPAP